MLISKNFSAQTARIEGQAIQSQAPSAPGSSLGSTLQRLEQVERTQAAGKAKADPISTAVLQYNALARDLVAKTKTNPPMASRLYAMVSLAQHQALEAAAADPRLSERAILDAASAAMLTHFFPGEGDAIKALAAKQQPRARCMPGTGSASASRTAGEKIASDLIAARKNDGHDAKYTGTLPEPKDGVWRSTANPPQPPALPMWAEVTPFFIPEKGAANRPMPKAPPAFGTKEFTEALAEVRQISDTRTPEQLEIAMFWADNAGTATPPGHWNQIAADYLIKARASGRETAKVLATMNAAMADAGIAAWDCKYEFWLIRPSQQDPKINVPEDLGLPNFPAYVSGHATFSGAAAEVLGHFMPEHASTFAAMAEEASMSRVYGGIHYRFDGTEGLKLGRDVAQFALRGASDAAQ